MAIIAGWKIDAVADLLTAKYGKQKAEKEKKMEELLTAAMVKKLPEDVVDFWTKHKDRLKMHGTVWFRFQVPGEKKTLSEGVYTKCPELTNDEVQEVLSNKPLKKKLDKLACEVLELSAKRREFRSKIKCTLATLKTYAKVRDNFPEAYEVLLTEVDGKEAKKDTCTDVEKLRAQLNQKPKK